MPTKKKTATKGGARKKSGGSAAARRQKESGGPSGQEKYEAALRDFTAAFDSLHKAQFAEALEAFQAIGTANPNEPELTDRCRSYANICLRKLAPAPEAPADSEGLYYLGVLQGNEGLLDEAVDTLTRSLDQAPGSVRSLYARSAVHAMQGKVDACVADLRSAVSLDPAVRFQAVNDSDFDKVRDEAAFIDVVEPTPTGV